MNPDARPLTIAHVDAETGYSGGEVQVFLLMDGLRRQGHTNVLFCPPGSESEAAARARGVEVESVPMRGDLDLAAVRKLRSRLRARGPDLVHLHTGRATWLGGLAARSVGLPAVTTRRMDRRVKRNWRTRLIYRRLVDHAVAISPAVAECLHAGGVARERTSLIPSSIDPDELKPSASREDVRAELGAGEGDVLLLVLASLVRRKGVDVLLEALAKLGEPRPRLAIAGDGSERASLERQATELGLASSVTFLGHRDDKADLLHACDVFVLPSRREGLGVAALEAMACGRPVVATDVGGLAEAVRDGRTGLVVPPEDPAALAGALERLSRNADARAAMGAEGPKRVGEGYLAPQMVASYEALYRRVLDGGRAS